MLMGIAATLALISELYQLQEEQNMWVDLSTATLTGGETDNGDGGRPTLPTPSPPQFLQASICPEEPLACPAAGQLWALMFPSHWCLKREMPIKQMPAQEGLLVQPTRSATTSLPNNCNAVLPVAVFGKAMN